MSTPVAFANIIDVDPEHHQEVIELLVEGIENAISQRPGFVSATVLASVDKTRVINVARWRSADDARATQSDPQARAYAERTAAIAHPQPGLYVVAAEHGGS